MLLTPADASQPATPLSELHTAQQATPPSVHVSPSEVYAQPTQPRAAATPPKKVVLAPKQRPMGPPPPPKKSAAHAPAHAAVKTATRAATIKHAATIKPAAQSTQPVSVLSIQDALISRGVTLKRDGLYGPKTAGAWQSMAKQKGLPPQISRLGPKTARVVSHTYDALMVPAIP
jgi:hypothetical protein